MAYDPHMARPDPDTASHTTPDSGPDTRPDISPRDHWDHVWTNKPVDDVSWYQPSAAP